MAIRAVCFDFDGLMFNTEHVFYDAAEVLLGRRQIPMSKGAMDSMLGRRPPESFRSLVSYLGIDEDPLELLAESRIIFADLLDSRLQPMPGLFELLDHVEELQLPKGVATSSPREYLDELLDRYRLKDRFAVTLTAEDVTHGKPHPEIYLTAASRMGVAAPEMLVLEDSQTGTKAGVSAGACVVSIPHDHTADHCFEGAAHIASGLDDPRIRMLLASCH